MNQIIKYLRFPFTFSEQKLVEELQSLTARWIAHFNTADYTGEWSALPLRSINGSLSNIIPEHNASAVFQDTELMRQCPYIQHILSHFPCEHKAVRLLRLNAGAIIKEHSDRGLCFEQGEARIHVPITTNPQLEFYIDGERVDMKPGECWYMNFDLPHRISNLGTTDRIHLVFDIIVNDTIRKMFLTGPTEVKKMTLARHQLSDANKKEMILRLKELNTPTALQLIEKLEAEIAIEQ